MKKKNLILLSFLLLVATLAMSQDAPKHATTSQEKTPSVATTMNRQIGGVEREFVPLAEAMPDDKFSFAPTNGEFKGVRTFAAMVKHVAVTNQLIAAAMLEEKPPALSSEESDNGPAALKTKAEIIQYLKDSFANLHRAADMATENNLLAPIQNPFGKGKTTRLAMAISAVGHTYDHYGQLVEYLRDNGIIPPASRPQAK